MAPAWLCVIQLDKQFIDLPRSHKHYPGKAIGHITKFFPSGRVGISGDRARSFLPKNLILLACEDSSITSELSPALNLTKLPSHVTQEMLDDDDDLDEPSPTPPTPPPTPPVPPAQAEELTEHSENCSQCGSPDLRRFHYHDPNEYYFYCRDCGHEGWRHEKLPPAQVEELEAEELDAIAKPTEAIATSEVMEVPPLEVVETEELEEKCCPHCGSDYIKFVSTGNHTFHNWIECEDCNEDWFVDAINTPTPASDDDQDEDGNEDVDCCPQCGCNDAILVTSEGITFDDWMICPSCGESWQINNDGLNIPLSVARDPPRFR
ncbi:hypothetical protein [Kamptonema formosum]|uniref:hypothetical protein n=1 Tax=Kamptonema formosum TaxID=331992 RepID=UPI00036CA631|nr:hypothetical protein [Kamptonema formosum]